MFPLAASDFLLLTAAHWLKHMLEYRHAFRLFQNDFKPDPSTILSDFIESSFMGYQSYSLLLQIPEPIKQITGEYVLSWNSPLFGCEGGTPQTVYGAYIDDGQNVKFSQAFEVPIHMSVGVSFYVPIQIVNGSLSVLA
jgi:hypothetical protein